MVQPGNGRRLAAIQPLEIAKHGGLENVELEEEAFMISEAQRASANPLVSFPGRCSM